jgi:hypothetical protein
MRMERKLALLVSVVALLAASVTLGKTKEQSAPVSLAFAVTLADGTQLQPGSYKVTLLSETGSPHIVFYKGGKLVCKCPVKLEDAGTKIPFTQISYDQGADKTRRITTMEIAGWTQKVILGGSGT